MSEGFVWFCISGVFFNWALLKHLLGSVFLFVLGFLSLVCLGLSSCHETLAFLATPPPKSGTSPNGPGAKASKVVGSQKWEVGGCLRPLLPCTCRMLY